jgi:hypothetical protein
MNNLGGYRSVELIFVDEIEKLAFFGNTVYLRKNIDTERLLPLHQNGANISTSPKTGDAGTTYSIKATIALLIKGTYTRLQHELMFVDVRGSILIATSHDSKQHVYGSVETPLFGTFVEKTGSQPSDFHHFELSLSGTDIHSPFSLPE